MILYPQPFFSIVIPVFNKEKYIAETLQSVLNQSFRDFELILVLDPSTDNTESIISEFEDSRIKIYRRNEAGPGGYAARNLGIKKSSSNWIAFQDADDLWSRNHLEVIYNAIYREKVEADVFCTGFATQAKGKTINSRYFENFKYLGPQYFDFKHFLIHKPINSINVVVKKKIFETSGGFPENGINRGGDHETWLRVMNIAKKGYWINEITTIYRKDISDSVIKTTIPLTYDHIVYVAVKKMLITCSEKAIQYGLKRFSNNFVITGVKRKFITAKLSLKDVNAIYYEAYSNKTLILFLKVFAILPFAMQKQILKIVKYIKS